MVFFLFPFESIKIAPPLFALVTLSNSVSVMLILSISVVAIAPAVLFECKFLNFVLEIVTLSSFLANIAVAYLDVVFKKLEPSTVAFEPDKKICPLIILSELLINVEFTTLTSEKYALIEAPSCPEVLINLQLLTVNSLSMSLKLVF